VSKKILSVGIDIGTSTTCVIFSELTVENVSASMRMPKAQIVQKTVQYRSPIYLTPLRSNTELEAEAIAAIVEQEYRNAGIKPEDVQTGAVIITGDTARKSNAQSVLQNISRYAGDFVVATAGPELESILAGKGSGADEYSRETTECICNMDIGGGTTNTATFFDGRVVDADCLDIGGRLIRFKKGTREVEYAFPKIQVLGKENGIDVQIGTTLSPPQIEKITDCMARAMLEKLLPEPKDPMFFFLCTEGRDGRKSPRAVDEVSFSGGVGKLIYDTHLPEDLAYDDIGVFLAKSIRKLLQAGSLRVVRPKETIGATVLGAGNHSVEVSGATITITQLQALPLKNLPILKIDKALSLTGDAFRELVEKNLKWIQGYESGQNVALSIKVSQRMRFQDINLLAERIVSSARKLIEHQDILVVVTLEDYGKVLGQCIQIRLPEGKHVLCIDSVDVGNADYIDIGAPLGIGDAVPVVIKTLAFSY